MVVGTQFSGSVGGNSSHTWFTWGWPAVWNVIWTVVPVSPGPGSPQLEWDVAVERASGSAVTYWITIRNLRPAVMAVEARYAITNI
jgi:hypothetical protein